MFPAVIAQRRAMFVMLLENVFDMKIVVIKKNNFTEFYKSSIISKTNK